MLQAQGLESVVDQDAQVVLLSCSTGEGRAKENNVANMMSRVLPGRVVFAPTEASSDQLKFDGKGRFVEPGYTMAEGSTFRAWRLQLSPNE